MQPEHTNISRPSTKTPAQEQPIATFQHGFQSPDLHPPQSLPEHRTVSAASSASLSGAIQDSLGHDIAAAQPLLSLNAKAVHRRNIGPSVHRISEHENASASLAQENELDGPYFRIIKGDAVSNGPRLESFPNEVLTHVLSHLPASSLSAVSLVSRRFYNLVTTPHAWRVAFSRFFPGQDAIDHRTVVQAHYLNSEQSPRESLRSEQRFFARLTRLASWRSEYVLRTRLLRSLMRGKPAQILPGHGVSPRLNGAANNTNAAITYNSQLFATISHIHAIFTIGKRSPRFIHGTDESGSACTSDPSIGKIDNWGLSDPQSLPQFVDLFPGDQPYGLGEGLFIGVPNVMEVSQPHGMVYGEGFPGGQTYFRSSDEMRGRFLASSNGYSNYELGIPKVSGHSEAICAVWIAKSHNVPSMTDGLIGIMTGSSYGIVTAYSLGAENLQGNRLSKGEVTVKWMLSPGVPVIAISVDESFDVDRKASERIFAVVLNALGEVYYLKHPPHRAMVERGAKLDENGFAKTAWLSGRSTYWNLVEPTRRVAREDPYEKTELDGSYSPRPSSQVMRLSKEQLTAETREVEKFLCLSPAYFRKTCLGWDMRRRLEVDFAGDDGMGAGENIVVLDCGIGPECQTCVKRFTRLKSEQASLDEYPVPGTPPIATKSPTMASLFGGGITPKTPKSKMTDSSPTHQLSPSSSIISPTPLIEEWRTSLLSLQGLKVVEITTSAIDMSKFSLLTAMEDPILARDEKQTTWPRLSGLEGQRSSSVSDIPGHRARLIAVGSSTGTIVAWDLRSPCSSNSSLVNELQPLRIIQTDSPRVSCLALSALYIIHGGNDGLVQTWDPLASTTQPLRTINSRFSSRARRRLLQAEASTQGVGINLFAAGAIILDPDPSVLRGMVSLGTHLRYWSYSSNVTDKYSGKKRRLRRSADRGNNSTTDRFTNTGRGALMDYIAMEQEELKKEKQRKAREEARLRGRFGVGIGGLSEEEAVHYAEMISQEMYQKDHQRRISDAGYVADSGESTSMLDQTAWSSETVTPDGSVTGHVPSPKYKTDDEFDHDMEEAIRLSLIDGLDDGGRSPRASGSGEYDIPIIVKQKNSKRSASSSPSTSLASKSRSKTFRSPMGEVAPDDLGLALRLSLAEELNVQESNADDDAFPALDGVSGGKGKGRAD